MTLTFFEMEELTNKRKVMRRLKSTFLVIECPYLTIIIKREAE